MTRGVMLLGLVLWAGATLVLSELRWFSRQPLVDRLRPYAPGGMGRPGRAGILSVESFSQAMGPLARTVGERLARVVGVSEELSLRLTRIHAPLDVTDFRVRQLATSVVGFGVGALVVLVTRPPGALALLVMAGGPALAFLVQEQRVAVASQRWQRRLFLELPVVAEQLALLLAAGYSLTSALNRLAQRSSGACGADLRRLCRRLRQGVSESDALREWATVAGVGALDRLVPVLALNQETSDLGRLMAEEARAIRRDVHRELIESAERRSQQVWIPVTVATLLPGVIFMGVPFFEALQRFGG
ncbi:MAG: type II secretion system F family protein [Acidimicrobiales bacterium]